MNIIRFISLPLTGVPGADPSNRPPLKPTKATLLAMIFYISVNSIRDLKPICRP